MAKFEEKLKELVKLGKRKKVFWRFRKSMIISMISIWTQNRWRKVFEYLESQNIDVLRINSDDDDIDDDSDICFPMKTKWIWRRSTCLFGWNQH